MRAITKGNEPKELTDYRKNPNATYKDLSENFISIKNKIREQLLQEQGYLCAYCMSRIDSTQMKIDHWHSRNQYPAEQLDYPNMLGACEGGEGKASKNQTCDTCKGSKKLKYNPANPSHRIENQIRFLGTGKIESDDAEFDDELNKVLNLNHSRLRENRKAIWDAIHGTLSRTLGTPAEIDNHLIEWSTPNAAGQLRKYCAVAVYYLRKRLAKKVV